MSPVLQPAKPASSLWVGWPSDALRFFGDPPRGVNPAANHSIVELMKRLGMRRLHERNIADLVGGRRCQFEKGIFIVIIIICIYFLIPGMMIASDSYFCM